MSPTRQPARGDCRVSLARAGTIARHLSGSACLPGRAGRLRLLATAAVPVLLAAVLVACAGGNEDPPVDEGLTDLQAKARSLEESLEALADRNAELEGEIAILRQERTDSSGEPDAAAQPAAQEDGQSNSMERLDDLEARVQALEEGASAVEAIRPEKGQWSKDKEELSPAEGAALERTVDLVEDSGGEVHYIDHPDREDRAVLVMPREPVEGTTPLIVSLHGFGGDSADQITYVPLHERVNADGFALLLPNGIRDSQGNRFWNPTDECCDSAKSGRDDVAYLTELVARAGELMDFGPVYFFGYSNGGFMAYHMACKGLPGLRAVASLAGTSYVEDTRCEGAAPVSVLHIHGSEDEVILFDGDQSEPDPEGAGERAFYAGAQDMVTRWARRAGCEWPGLPQPYATLDLDEYLAGSETEAFRLEPICGEGINIELWIGVGSSHAPGYGEAFAHALVRWLMSQE